MTQSNTVNICLGHLPFPAEFAGYVDLMVAPKLLSKVTRLAVVEDERFGANGHTLSEYSQLFWIMEHLGKVAPDVEYIRICHYRRFAARQKPSVGERSANISWATTIRPSQLDAFSVEFDRHSPGELFNTPVHFPAGVLGQYASDHVIEDFLSFTRFMVEEKIMSPAEAVRFLEVKQLIPSCNIGIFKKETYMWLMHILANAARFLHSHHFTLRADYQRRSVGFLLERLHSYLIFRRIEAGASPATFGYNLVISDGTVVSATS